MEEGGGTYANIGVQRVVLNPLCHVVGEREPTGAERQAAPVRYFLSRFPLVLDDALWTARGITLTGSWARTEAPRKFANPVLNFEQKERSEEPFFPNTI